MYRIKLAIKNSYCLYAFYTFYRQYIEKYGKKLNPMFKFCVAFGLTVDYWQIMVKMLQKKYLCMIQVEVPITTRCTLKCKDCTNLMQYYDHPYDVSIEDNIRAVDRLLEAVDCIMNFIVLGGEPFLYPQITTWLKYLLKSPKIKKVQIFTNGTIVPKDDVMDILCNRKVHVIISDYGKASKKIKQLDQAFTERKISHEVKFSNSAGWRELNGISCRNRSERGLIKQYYHCAIPCRSMLKGKLHICPMSSHGMDLGIVPEDSSNYIDILDETSTVNEIRANLFDFLYKKHKYISACNYCDAGIEGMEQKRVSAGIQMER